MAQVRDGAQQLGGVEVDRIDAIVPPGTDVTRLVQQYQPPALLRAELRRRPVAERSAA